jgi:hypothetical protein
MITLSPEILRLATALADSEEIEQHCVENYGKAPIIQVGENPGDPLSNEDAPWIILWRLPGSAFGPVSENNHATIIVHIGVTQKYDGTGVLRPRTTTASGLQVWGAGERAEALSVLVAGVLKSVILDKHLMLTEVDSEVDGATYAPLETASFEFKLSGYRTLSEW